MPSNKTLFILIICFGIVISIFLLTRNSDGLSVAQNTEGISVKSYINIDKNLYNDWQKILIDIGSNSSTTILTSVDTEAFDETTLTGQMSRDFLSQYLSATKSGAISAEESALIAENTLSMPWYTGAERIKYISKNLHIIDDDDAITMQTYENALNKLLKDKSSQVTEHPLVIFQDAITRASETRLAKLDQIILLSKSFLNGLLGMNVPKSAVNLHLSLLNVSSNLTSDIEAIRVVFVDPVRSLTAVSQYQKDELELKKILGDISVFLSQN